MIDAGLRAVDGPGADEPIDLPLPPGLIAAISSCWRNRLAGIVAFGSRVRGEATAGSDLDLLIVLEGGSPIGRALYDRWEEVCRALPPPGAGAVSPQFVALPQTPENAGGLWLEVAREGRILYDCEGRLVRFLSGLRDFMMSGAVARRTVHGQPYWVREEPGK
jgi:hypothetical protein